MREIKLNNRIVGYGVKCWNENALGKAPELIFGKDSYCMKVVQYMKSIST